MYSLRSFLFVCVYLLFAIDSAIAANSDLESTMSIYIQGELSGSPACVFNNIESVGIEFGDVGFTELDSSGSKSYRLTNSYVREHNFDISCDGPSSGLRIQLDPGADFYQYQGQYIVADVKSSIGAKIMIDGQILSAAPGKSIPIDASTNSHVMSVELVPLYGQGGDYWGYNFEDGKRFEFNATIILMNP